MEQFNPNTLEGTIVSPENSNTQEALLRRGDNEAIQGLESLGDVDATRDIVSSLASNNPLFAENLGNLQNTVGTSLIREMSNENTELIAQGNLIDYFSLSEENIVKLQEQVSEVGLDIFTLLSSLQKHIENKLNGLPEQQKEKIRISIGKRTENIGDIVSDMKEESSSPEDFMNKRWILDEKIGDAFNFYTAELFPTLEVKLALARGEEVPSIYTDEHEERTLSTGATYLANNQKRVDVEMYMEEIDELLNASLDSEGNFDEGFFSTQRLMKRANENHSALFDDMGIDTAENISLLSEEDKQIQQRAMIAYFILIGVQMVPYLGAPISLGVDSVDAFSSHDGTLELGKSLGMIHDDFQMEKQWYDNALGGIGLALTAVGLQGIAKGEKLADSFASLEKIGFGKIEEMLQEFGNTLGISQERLQSISDYLRSLFRGDIDEASNGGRVDEGAEISHNTEKNYISNEILLELEELGIPREFYEIVEGSDLFKTRSGTPMDIIGRFTRLRDVNGADLNSQIDKVMGEIPGLTRTEAFTIFAYTDNYLYHNINPLLRSGVELTSKQQRLIDTLNSGLSKMPNYSGDTILLRGDNYDDYLQGIGTEINLDGYTSVSNNINDTFIGDQFPDNFLIEIKGLEGRIKDISGLAMFTNFARNIGRTPTINEGVILSGSKIIITNKENRITEIRGEMIDVLTITVEQIQ